MQGGAGICLIDKDFSWNEFCFIMIQGRTERQAPGARLVGMTSDQRLATE